MKNAKVLLSVLLAVMMLVSAMTFVSAAEADKWDGTADTSWYVAGTTEYTFTTAEQLAGLSKLVKEGTDNFNGVKFKLAADLVLNEGDYTTWGETAPANKWTPIGDYDQAAAGWGKVFGGSFDGQGHTITGLYVDAIGDASNLYYGGLFGCVGTESDKEAVVTIENIIFKGAYVKANNGAAVVVGSNRVLATVNVKNVKVDGAIIDGSKKSNGTGLIVGRSGSAYGDVGIVIENCTAIGKTINNGGEGAAGILGYQSGGSTKAFVIKNCYADVEVEATQYAGGIFGQQSGASNITIENCYVTGKVTATGDRVGGVIGCTRGNNTSSVTLKNVVSNVAVEGNSQVGGVAGAFVHNKNVVTMENVAAFGTVKSTNETGNGAKVGAVVGYVGNSGIADATHTYKNVLAAATVSAVDTSVTITGVGGVYDYAGTIVEGATIVTDQAAFAAGLDAAIWDTNAFTLKNIGASFATVTPPTEETTPKAEETTPKAEETTPKVEETTPKAEETTPKADDTTGTLDPSPTGDMGMFVWVALAAVAVMAVASTALYEKKKATK